MNAFAKPPLHPFGSLWIALVAGCVIGSIVVAVFGANMPFLVALFFSLLGGGALALATMPVVWLFVRIGYAGPASAVLIVVAVFVFVMEGPLELFPREAILPGVIYVGAVLMCYLLIAYTPALYRSPELKQSFP